MIRETTKKSWFKRIGDSFAAAGIGLILCVAGPWLQWWNEGRTIDRLRDLQEGIRHVVNADPAKVESAKDGKLVHLNGRFTVHSQLVDNQFGVGIAAARLRRTVEMFQWEQNESSETKEKLGGGSETVTTYSYAKIWKGSLIDSRGFKDVSKTNPTSMRAESKVFNANEVQLGAFRMDEALIVKFPGWEALPPDDELTRNVANVLGTAAMPVVPAGEWLHVGRDPVTPEIGDLRIRFEAVLPKEISVVAGQSGSTLRSHTTSRGGALVLVVSGNKSASEMFATARAENTTLAWLLRGAGALLLWIGMIMVASPLSALAAVIPFLGRVVGFITGFASVLIAVAISIGVIGIAWVAHRPLVGIPLLVGGLLLAFWSRRLVKPPRPTGPAPMERLPI